MAVSGRPKAAKSAIGRRYRTVHGLARTAAQWELLWPRLWPVLAVLLLFLSVALFDLLPMLPHWLHGLVLAVFVVLFIYRARGIVTGHYRVSHPEVQRRIERDSGLDHRPLSTLDDKPVYDRSDVASARLWDAHLARVATSVDTMRVRLPSPGLAAFDPYVTRFAVLLVFAVSLAFGADEPVSRIMRALVPSAGAAGVVPLKVDLWITPPAYSGRAPVFLERTALAARTDAETEGIASDAGDPLEVPVGSTVLAQVDGVPSPTRLEIGERRVDLAKIGKAGEGGARAEATVESGDQGARHLRVASAEKMLAEWPVRVIPDGPPKVEFLKKPEKSGRASLEIAFEARDDFGVMDMWVSIGRPVGNGEADRKPATEENGKSLRFPLSSPGLGTRVAKGLSVRDLSDHPWAGTMVDIQLSASDALGGIGNSERLRILLPERIFNHPVARALAAERKKLNDPTGATVAGVIRMLGDINSRPAHFFHDTVVFLAISIARARLAHSEGDDEVASVQKLMWDTALRIEDGEFSLAERELRERQEEVMRALREGANDRELEKLLDQLQAALDKYLAALSDHLERQGLSDMPMNPAARTMESGDLQKMIERARELARTGAKDAARRMLSQLNELLNSIRNGAFAANPQMNREMQGARRALEGWREMSRRQQQLLDRTFREMQQGGWRRSPRSGEGAQPQRGRQGKLSPEARGVARDQDQLRRDLGDLMLRMDQLMGSILPGLGEAERSMKGAGQSLREGEPSNAVRRQTDALEQLRQATESFAEQLARRLGNAMGMAPNQPGRNPGQGRDPFGRGNSNPFGGATDNQDVRIPDQSEILRAREILDELRRRAGQFQRPQLELDYIDRLIRRF